MGEIPPIPPNMTVILDHDGARWSLDGQPIVAACALLAALAAIALATMFRPWGLAAAGPVWMISGLVLFQSLQRTSVRVSSREITLERRSLIGVQRTSVRVDDIVHHAVATSDRGEAALVLKTREETVVIGAGRDPHHLAWLAHAVTSARRITGLREQEEGREWSFLRKAPEALHTLRR